MRSRPRLRRLLATLTSSWFALYVAVAPVALPCPMPHEAARADAAPMAAHDSHDAHAGHAMAVTEGGTDDAPAPIHPCDCTTDCCSVPAAALPSAAQAGIGALITPRTATPPAPPLVRAASRTLLLPFAHGPPA